MPKSPVRRGDRRPQHFSSTPNAPAERYPQADAVGVTILFDTHIDSTQHIRSVLWAMSALLSHEAAELMTHSTRFEMKRLVVTGIHLAEEFLEVMIAERDGLSRMRRPGRAHTISR